MKCMHCGGKTRVLQTFAYETDQGPRVQRRRRCDECRKVMETIEEVKVRREHNVK